MALSPDYLSVDLMSEQVVELTHHLRDVSFKNSDEARHLETFVQNVNSLWATAQELLSKTRREIYGR